MHQVWYSDQDNESLHFPIPSNMPKFGMLNGDISYADLYKSILSTG